MYYTGIGKPKDYQKAFSMLLPLAKRGYPEAARLVGLMKLSGKGTVKDSTQAKQWLSIAAQRAIYQLSVCLNNTNHFFNRFKLTTISI